MTKSIAWHEGECVDYADRTAEFALADRTNCHLDQTSDRYQYYPCLRQFLSAILADSHHRPHGLTNTALMDTSPSNKALTRKRLAAGNYRNPERHHNLTGLCDFGRFGQHYFDDWLDGCFDSYFDSCLGLCRLGLHRLDLLCCALSLG